MLANIGMIPNKEGTAIEVFRNYWIREVGPRISKISGVCEYVENHIIGSVQNVHPTSDVAVDCLDVLRFENPDSVKRFFSSGAIEVPAVGEGNFTGHAKRFV